MKDGRKKDDRGKSGKAVQEGAQRPAFLEAMFAAALSGIFVIDRKGRYVDVNPAGCGMFGYTREEFLSSDISMLVFPEDLEKYFETLDGLFRRGIEGGTRERRMRRKDGTEIWVELTVNPFTINNTFYALGIKREITEDRRLRNLLLAGETLRVIVEGTSSVAGEEFLRSLVRHLSTALKFRYALIGEVTGDKKDTVRTHGVWTGEGFAEDFEYGLGGTPCGNVVGREPCVYPRGVAGLFPQDSMLKEMGVESYMGVPLFNSAGAPLGVLVAMDGKPMAEEGMESARTVMSIFAQRASFEIERKNTVESLKKSEERLREAQKMARLGSWEWDIAKDAARWSDETYSIFGVEKGAETSSRAFFESVHPDDREAVKKAIDDALSRKKPYDMELRIIRPDGTECVVSDRAEVVLDESGRPVRMVGTVQDITERKKMEAELLKAQKLDSIGVLAGGLAHDFNNLLLGILGNVSVAKALLTSGDKAARILDEVEKAALRSKELTKKLLTFSRGGSPVREPAPIDRLVTESAGLLLRATKIESEFSFPPDLPLVEIDEGQMSQVINNIVLNAVHAMPGGGVINFRGQKASVAARDGLPLKEGDYVKVTIRDHGMGMTPKVLSRIFDPFFTTKQNASGLGLSLSYSIVKKHNGFISAESEPGKGTALHIYLPSSASGAARGGRATGGIPDAALVTGKGRVLVMDDEEMVRDVSREMLDLLGYEAECVADGKEAVEFFMKAKEEGRPFDAVILDLTVPGGMGGVETVERLLEIDPGVRAIVSSGYSRDPIMSDYKKYGFRSVMAKPYRVAEFSRVVKGVLG